MTDHGKTILYVIIDAPQPGAEPKLQKLAEIGEVTSMTTAPADTSSDQHAQEPPTPAATLTLTMSVKMEFAANEERQLRHALKEQAMLGWRPEPTRPPAQPRRPHGRPRWFRTRSFCVRRGWH